MKKVCTIVLTVYDDPAFSTNFEIEDGTPEYILADEAWRLALMFAQTQAFAHSLSVQQVLDTLDYKYTINEVIS